MSKELEVIITCPLGSACEEIKDNKHYRCRWFQKLYGKNPQSEELLDERRCVFEWSNILQIEHSQFERQTGKAVESFRNLMVEGQNMFLNNVSEIVRRNALKKKDTS